MIGSLNFEMLRRFAPELADVGAFAEQYVYTDPSSAILKLRVFAEQSTWLVYRTLRLTLPPTDEFHALLTHSPFQAAVPPEIEDRLHALRKTGNRAAHGKVDTSQTALALLEEGYRVACWLAVRFGKTPAGDLPSFQTPPSRPAAAESLRHLAEQNRQAQEKIATQEAELQQRLDELQATRQQYEAIRQKADELQALADAGKLAYSALKFDEATTRRRLIDAALAEAGWHIGANGANTEQVTQEQALTGLPTETGKGFADYVLWDEDGKPLAVIEAKRTAKDPAAGRTQARLYADALQQAHGLRPLIFLTNGYDVTVWDDAQGYPERPLFGFYSRDTLQYRVRFQRQSKLPLDTLGPRPEIVERLYQIEAVKRVTERFTDKHRKALIVQATGTGKTRVAIALADLLMRAGWVRRVLFLCDRRELRKQARDAFRDFVTEPITYLESGSITEHKTKSRIFVSTYPALQQVYASLDPGFFDLIIADESHRSIYNVYGDLFRYFDGLQLGLTATPVEHISRNTFALFGCEKDDATFSYSLEKAVEEGYLVPFEVYTHTTEFLRKGIRY